MRHDDVVRRGSISRYFYIGGVLSYNHIRSMNKEDEQRGVSKCDPPRPPGRQCLLLTYFYAVGKSKSFGKL
eukprot:scaffold2205_cov141-Skeletonema_menzelii.AAC.9